MLSDARRQEDQDGLAFVETLELPDKSSLKAKPN
jgi:hypothetical protein